MNQNTMQDSLHVHFGNLTFPVNFKISSEESKNVGSIEVTNFNELTALFQTNQKTKQKLGVPAKIHPNAIISFPNEIHKLQNIMESYAMRVAILINHNIDIHPMLQNILESNKLYKKRWPKQIHKGMIKRANAELLPILGDKFSVILKRDVLMNYSNSIFAKSKTEYENAWNSILGKPRFYCNICGGNRDYTSPGYCGH